MMDIKTLLEDEIDILYTTLDRLKIYDIRLSHTKDGRIFAKDADSQWTGKNFYKFLLNDAIVYNQDGTSSVLTEHTLTSLRQLGKHYGAAFPFMELEENPIKYAEMSMEQNYNMIDGIINNISVQEETAKKEEPVTANEVLKQKSETPLLRVVPVNRFERYIEPGEITQDQYIVKGGILLTPCASNPDFYESSNRRVNGSYIDAHIYEVAERSKRGKPTAFVWWRMRRWRIPLSRWAKKSPLPSLAGFPVAWSISMKWRALSLPIRPCCFRKNGTPTGITTAASVWTA